MQDREIEEYWQDQEAAALRDRERERREAEISRVYGPRSEIHDLREQLARAEAKYQDEAIVDRDLANVGDRLAELITDVHAYIHRPDVQAVEHRLQLLRDKVWRMRRRHCSGEVQP
jgi:hypothetical protein